MNKQLYRLVFSQHLGMFVPAPETASGHGGKSSCSLARGRRRALLALLSAGLVQVMPAMADQPAGLVPHATQAWSNAAIDAARTSANQMTIRQTASKAILNWQQLNLARGQTLNFDQQGNRSWAALNRIYDANPSNISGNVNADGHLYFVNSNGIIFGNGAQINVGSLTATTLGITDDLFKAGILSNPSVAAFGDLNNVGFVRVEAGATLNSATGGRVMLLAPDVTNSGVISTPEGQTILAAGKKVYLTKSDDPAGLLVEVDSGGTATNLGEIVSRLGNVTLVGLAVNQQGRISASTSVRANGSIRLLARDTTTVTTTSTTTAGVTDTKYTQTTARGGVVTLGEGSVTQVDVEAADKEEILKAQLVDATGKKVLGASRVEMSGGVINIDGNIVAHGGEVSATAAFNPGNTAAGVASGSAVDATRVYLGDHASIDVSGVDATAPMSRNQLAIQLYSEQLKDTPLLRGTSLVSKTVYVDARKGTNLIAADALEAAKAVKGVTIAEVMSKAGTVNLESRLGDVVVSSGAKVDVSGGSVSYEAGTIRESQLTYNGKTVAIADANKTTPYDGLADSYSVTSQKWGVTRTWDLGGNQGQSYAAYKEGSDAGAVNITAQNALLQGNFKAGTQPGLTQRELLPAGGTFNFTLNTTGLTGLVPTFRVVASNPDTLPNTFTAVGSLDASTEKFAQGSSLPAGDILLDHGVFANGFSKFTASTGSGAIVVDAAVKTAPKGSVTLTTAGQAAVNADIVTPGGTIAVTGGDTSVADHVTISASGLYTNDTAGVSGAMQAPVAVNGGKVSVVEKDNDKGGLTLGQGVAIRADAGAWQKSNGKLTGGNGGDVTLGGVASVDGVEVSALGFSKGGTLALSTFKNLQAGGKVPPAVNTLWLQEGFFGNGGFSKYAVETSQTGTHLLIGDTAGTPTEIHPQMQTLVMAGGSLAKSSGTDMAEVADRQLKIDGLRVPASVTFKSAGTMTLDEHATIRTDAPGTGTGGAINLQSFGQMNLLGTLDAPAGSISATINGTIAEDYDNTLSLFVGPRARLSATGHYAVLPSSNGALNANVLDAGNITLDGGARAVVVVKEGSVLDVNGASGQADIASDTGVQRKTLYGAAGNIAVSARDGMVLDGTMHAAASGTGTKGSLTLTFSGGDDSAGLHPNGARVLTVTQQKQVLGAGLQAGGSVSGVVGGGAVSAEQIADAGFGNVKLDVDRGVAGDKVLLANNLSLQGLNALTMKTSQLEVAGGKATLAADYMALGGDAVATATTGAAELQANAKWIDLVGDLAVSGVQKTTLAATQDIRARGTKAAVEGSLVTPGAMVLSARQIYPVTNGVFRFEASGPGSSIEVKSSGLAPTVPLSAGGKLTLKAGTITQGGVVRAPLGQIALDATDNLTLKAGSLTSVSAEGQLIPYGLTRLGGLDLLAPTSDLVASESGTALTSTPAKKIELKAALVDTKTGAKVDISGGGDTLAYEWINGIGGSSDILAQPGVYAILPNLKGEFAPFDYNFVQTAAGIKPGDSVHLTNIPGLADGNYNLLPARYALLPGAYMVQVSSTALSSGQSARQVDGSTLVSGYRLNGLSRDTLDSTFKVTSGSIFHTAKGEISHAPSEYKLTTGNRFFTSLAAGSGVAAPRLAMDAGQLVINASSNLVLDADVLADKSAGARGALVDIVSDKIQVVSALGGAAAGTLQLTSGSLNDLNAESLLLGGVRTQSADGYAIATGASSVEFANDADHKLATTELIAAASDTLVVKSGASIETLASTAAPGKMSLHASGDGALLAVSSLNDLEFDRTGATNAKGSLSIASGSTLKANRSMVLDSTAATPDPAAAEGLAGSVSVADGGTMTLGANRVLLGAAGNSVTGLRVSNSLLDSFGKLSRVALNSYKNIDIYGPVGLGNDTLDVTLNTGGIGGHMAANEAATLTARNFTLKNTNGATYEAVAAAPGSVLNVNAANVLVSGGSSATNTTIGGFEHVNLNAAGEIKFTGTGKTTVDATQTSVTSSRITAATGADYNLAATGSLATIRAATVTPLPDASGLGAKLTMTGSSVTLGGNVVLPSGKLVAQATSGNLTVAADANVQAGSVPVKFDQYTQYTPGGSVTLQADLGNVAVSNGAVVDVSGGSDGDAGTISVNAINGSTTIAGTLKGQASAGHQAGSFLLDTKVLPDFSGLNTALNAGGFSATRDMRVRTGDVTIAAGDNVVARHVVLSADGGKVDVAGTVDASGSNGGKVEIYARDNVTLKNGSQILARGTGDTLVAGDGRTGAGGEVVLSSLSKASINAISAEGNALIDVSGDQQGAVKGDKGSVTMRAYRGTTGNTNTVNVAFGTTAAVTGAETVRVEGVKVYTSPTFTSATSTIVADTNAFYTANPGAGSYAATQDGGAIAVLPNIEVRSSSTATATDMTVGATATDLNMRAFGALQVGKGGTVTLRSNKNLLINGSLSDGFNTAATTGTLQTGNNFSYDLVAGADFAAANPMATIRSATAGNFSLASSKLIRTGQGGIRIAAGGNLTLGNDASVIYTVGRKADDLAGFTNQTNAQYLTHGGDVEIRAKGNITGALGTLNTQQLVNNWLFREGGGTQNRDVSWWVRPDLFKAGVATFGGGNIVIEADGNITNFSAATPTTARYDSNGAGNYRVDGGGDVTVMAGGDIANGVYQVGRGIASLQAGGSIRKLPNGANNPPFGTVLALQDARADVRAVNSAYIESVFNPTLFAQASTNSATPLGQNGKNGSSPYFLSYGDQSAFHLHTLTGDATLGLSSTTNITGRTSGLNGSQGASAAALEIMPSSVDATAFSGNINVGRLVMAPGAQGNLSLLAAGNVSSLGNGLVAMSDASPSLMPSLSRILDGADSLGSILPQFRTAHAATPLHEGDLTPVSIVARDGSIILPGAVSSDASAGPGLTSPKAAYVHAGKDVQISASIQNLRGSDISVIEAGRDLTMPTQPEAQIRLGGPGELLVQAGRDVSLGTSKGVVTIANTLNAGLPAEGASMTVLAGLGSEGANVDGYVSSYINPTGAGPSVLQGDAGKLASYRRDTSNAVAVYMRKLTGNSALSEADAMTQYLALDKDRQAVFAYRHFSSELLASGKGFATSGNNNRGDTAIAALFPGSRSYNGDLSLYNSQLRTSRDGSIDILTPGGFINAGVPTSSGSDIGIVTEHGGDIRAFAETGFQVEQSKVITQFGSDITVWVNNGDIDAGRGSKTAVSVPKRVVSTDADGNTTIEVKGVAAGSGIRAQTYDPDGPSGAQVAPDLGSVALIAPRGVLNASEAGIAAGNFLAVATQVLGANNISVSGTSSGVPAADSGSLAGSLAGVSNVASDATKSVSDDVARQAAQSAANAFSSKSVMPSFISVEVIGLGE